ncbi:BglG family transcription antiterminator [Bavariicoccus seileri]|uniref:BglG family transcription antiterminator n=1 Tax=Bavariicoccus seileri TaxID=549685 RepID=UPI0003B5DB90|nr:PTS sugar transporter subunit IIA [Bavariicoccus seileri]
MRAYTILETLANSKDYLSIDYFMEKLNVSKRTVQNEFSYLRKVSRNNGFSIKTSYGKGYFLTIGNSGAFTSFMSKIRPKNEIYDEEKVIFNVISLLLLNGDNFDSTSNIAEELQISDTLLYGKMKTVSGYLSTYNLILERKSHYGVRIIGASKHIRKLMLDLYMKGSKRLKKATDERLNNFTNHELIIEEVIKKNELRIGYYEFTVFVCWFKVLVMYIATWEPNRKRNNKVEAKGERQESIVSIIKEIENEYDINIEQCELIEVEKLLERSTQSEKRSPNLINKNKLKKELLQFFVNEDKANKTDYSKDSEFLEQLATHLVFLLDRIDRKITYKNPLLLELCIRYPMIFDNVLKFSEFLKEYVGENISNDELGFITVHFLNHVEKKKNKQINKYERVAVVCTTGGGISNLIKTQIINIFPTSFVKTFSFWVEKDLELFQPDIIFSVVPLKKAPNVPTIYIKELLTDKDIINIKKVLFLENFPLSKNKVIDSLRNYLVLFKSNLFMITEISDYHDLIRMMARKMIEHGYANKEFERDVLLREEYMSTVYKNGIGIPHPIEMKAQKSAIAVAIVKPEIKTHQGSVKLVFMVCLSTEDFHYYSQISNGLFQLMQDRTKIQKIYNNPVLQNVTEVLRRMDG